MARQLILGGSVGFLVDQTYWRGRAQLRRGEKLGDKIESQLAAIKRMPRLVESFFLAPTVAYITDWLARTSTTFWFAGCLMSSVRERWRTSLSPELIDD